MTRRRRTFREIEVIETLLIQGVTIPCFRCGIAFTRDDVKAKNIQKEHLHEHVLDGPDMPDNCRFSHKPCHAIITNGNGATTAGSSKNRIAKATQPKRIAKFAVNKPPTGERPQRTNKARIPGRVNAWPARGSRPMNRKRRA